MKHSLLILISFLLLSSPVIGDSHKGETLFWWETPSGRVWKGFGDKEIQPEYKGDVKNGKPDGLGVLIYSFGWKYVGSWKDGKMNGHGIYSWGDGSKYVGEWKDNKRWNGTQYDKNGNIERKYVNGEIIKQ